MSTGLVQLIKQISLDAYGNSKPTDLRFGTVTSVTPLTVRVTSQFTIPESMLIVPEHLTEHEREISILKEHLWETKSNEGISKGYTETDHNHEILVEKKKIKIHAELKPGEKVALLRKAGGQSYLILDRIK